MLTLPYVSLPETLTGLLRVNMQSSGRAFLDLQKTLITDKAMYALLTRAFKEIDKDVRIEALVKSLGWHGLRDRMTSLFIYREINDSFPKTTYPELVADILAFEDKLKDHVVSGFSRAFLYAFYTKMALLNLRKDGDEKKYKNILVRDEHIRILKKKNIRVKKIDWLLITVQHFEDYFGIEEFEKMLDKGFSFEQIFARCNMDQKENYVSNMLAYGASIGEPDFFYEDLIVGGINV